MKSAAAARRLPARTTLLLAFAATLVFTLLAPGPALAQSPSRTESPLTDARPTLGILGLSAPDGSGVTVARVVPNSGADEAGLEAGDLITELEGKKLATIEDLTTALSGFKIDETVTLTYSREGESQTAEVKLGSSRAGRNGNPFRIPNFDPRFPEDAPNAPGNPNPRNPERPNFSQSPVNDTDYRPVITLFGLLITAALVTLIVLQVRKDRPLTETAVQTSAYVPPATATQSNPLEILKMRYAKGEITRDEYLTMSSDLNGAGAPAGESPTQEL